MADVPQQTTLRKIRTFADDVKRAGGGGTTLAAPPVGLQTNVPARTRVPQAVPVQNQTPAIAHATLPASATKNLEEASLDLRADTEDAVADATIIRDNRAKHSFTDELTKGMGSWVQELTSGFGDWNEKLKQLLEQKKAAPAMVPDIAPTMQGTTVPPAAAMVAPALTPRQAPPVPSSDTTSWRRISEPRAEVPLPHATPEEARAFRETLVAHLPKPEQQSEPLSTFKAARPVRPVTDLALMQERLAALEAKVAAPAFVPPVPEAQPEPHTRVSRDIPFIPPNYSGPQEATPLRTYRNDALADVAEQHLSAPQIASAELNRRSLMRAPIVIGRTPSRLMPILMALGLVIMLGGGATFIYQQAARPNAPTEAPTAGFFKTDKAETVVLTDDRVSLLSTLASARARETLSAGQFVQWIIDAPLSETLAVIDPRVPGTFLRSLTGGLMFGAYGERATPYLVLKTTSYEAGFAGMLAWEDAMSADLAPFFGEPVRKSYEAGALTVDQTRPAYFKDDVFQNRDVRLLLDETGTTRIIYTFIDETTIVIAGDAETLDAVARKLR